MPANQSKSTRLTPAGHRKFMSKLPDDCTHLRGFALYYQLARKSNNQISHNTVARVLKRKEGVNHASIANLFAAFGMQICDNDWEYCDPPATPIQGHLPIPTTPFVGRTEERKIIADYLLQNANALASLIGPGGMGKSRLALEIAADLANPLHNAVWWIELTELTSEQQLRDALTRVMKLAHSKRSIAEKIANALGSKPALLVLDNFDTLLTEGVGLLTQIQTEVPNLRILVTSRRLLNLHGEQKWYLEILPTPALHASLDQIAESPAVQLLLNEAHFANPALQLTADNAESIASLCRKLEGIPLALVIVAARLGMRTPSEINADLDNGFLMLEDRRVGGLPRHRSLYQALDWSFRLLNDSHQTFFSRLALFSGGWTLEMAKDILQEPHALEYLTELRDYSLVQVEQQNEQTRYRFLDTVREFASLQQQTRNAETEAQRLHEDRRRHFAYFLALAQEADAYLVTESAPIWRQRLDIEQDNFRSALRFAHTLPSNIGLQLACALGRYWYQAGHAEEGIDWLQKMLLLHADTYPTHTDTTHTDTAYTDHTLRANAYKLAGNLAYLKADTALARQLYGEWQRLSEEMGHSGNAARALVSLSNVARMEGNLPQAREYLMASLSLFDLTSETDRYAQAVTYGTVAMLDMDEGNDTAAIDGLTANLARWQALQDPYQVALTLTNLADALSNTDRHREAVQRLKEALSLCGEQNDQRRLANCLLIGAHIAITYEQWEHAATLMGAEEGIRNRIAHHLHPETLIRISERTALIEQNLPSDRFTQVWKQGAALLPDQALTACQEALTMIPTTSPSPSE